MIGFPVFPNGTKSLLSKHLTREIWAKYKDSEDKYKYAFKECIFPGCKHPDSEVGVYAGSVDSYKLYSDLFDKIIESYHGHKKADKHATDLDITKLNIPALSEEESKHIKSIKISA